jgi:hypothetical protein
MTGTDLSSHVKQQISGSSKGASFLSETGRPSLQGFILYRKSNEA